MKTKRPLSKKIINRFETVYTHWSVNEGVTILTGDFATKDYIAGLIFQSRVIVMASVHGIHPVYSLHEKKVVIKISAPSKTKLDETHLAFAEKISEMFLSTKTRRG